MMRLLIDESLDNRILRGVLQLLPELDAVRVQDPEVGLLGAKDPEILTWSALNDRILVTPDLATIPAHVLDCLDQGKAVPGIIFVRQTLPLQQAIEDLYLVVTCFSAEAIQKGIFFYIPEQSSI